MCWWCAVVGDWCGVSGITLRSPPNLDQRCRHHPPNIPNQQQQHTHKPNSGTAEIFGTELVVGKSYGFCDAKLACFSWHGAVLETSEEEGVGVSVVRLVLLWGLVVVDGSSHAVPARSTTNPQKTTTHHHPIYIEV